jgi:4-hydroxy-tetrahydrodipicolinate reductase
MGSSVISTALQNGHVVKNKVSSKDRIEDLFSDTEVIIDFSSSIATESMLLYATDNKKTIPIIIGTTGLSKFHDELIEKYSEFAPVFRSPNMSVAVSILNIAVYMLSQALGDDFDAEIFEKHHRLKKDAPSGTALMLGKTIAKARGHDFLDMANFVRYGVVAPRKRGEIGFSIQRCGNAVGEHRVNFVGASEEIVISHNAFSRKIFADGAIKVAPWIKNQKPGLYSMHDYTRAMILPVVQSMCEYFFESNIYAEA